MRQFILCLSTLLAFTNIFADPNITAKISPSNVNTSVVWPDKDTLNPDDFVEKFFIVLKEEYYMERFDKAYEEVIDVKENPQKHTVTTQKMVYYFAKSRYPHYPEALVSFKVVTMIFTEEAAKDPNLKIIPTVTITLEEPFQLYTDYFDFALDKFDSTSIDIKVIAKSDGTNWTVNMVFQLKSLFIIGWLSSVKQVLKLKEEPKVHSTLLFFKQRFDDIGQKIYEAVK